MPSGHPKDPEATRAKMREAAAKRREEKARAAKSDAALAELREKLTGGSNERTYKDDNPNMLSRDELEEKLARYGRVIDDLEGQLRDAQGVEDELRDKLRDSERRLHTVLDLIGRNG